MATQLPYEASDSEEEFIIADQNATSPPSSPQHHKVSYFQPPNITRINDTTAIPTSPTLVLATDLASSAFFKHALTKVNAVEVLSIQALIQSEDKFHTKNKAIKVLESKAAQQQTVQDAKKNFVTYTLFLLPNTNTLIGITNLEIPTKYANFIAQMLFPPQNSYFTAITAIYTFNAVQIPKLSAQLQLEFTSAEVYPIFFTINNQVRLVDSTPLPLPPIDPKTTRPIPPLPPTVPITGFNAAILTYATLYNVLCTSFVSIQNVSYMVELWTSFEKCSKLYELQQINHVPSIYGEIDRLTVGIKNEAMKAIIKIYENNIAFNNKVLPHTKQSGQVPSTMFV